MLDSAQSGPSNPSDPPPVPQLRRELRSWTRDLAVALGLALVIIIFLYQPVKVEGTSMAPLLSDQERIFINKFVYRFEPIDRGDVVVFWYPLDRSKSFIKRVIGLARRNHRNSLRPSLCERQGIAGALRSGKLISMAQATRPRKIPPDELFRDGRPSRQLQRFAHVRPRPAGLIFTARPYSPTGPWIISVRWLRLQP